MQWTSGDTVSLELPLLATTAAFAAASININIVVSQVVILWRHLDALPIVQKKI